MTHKQNLENRVGLNSNNHSGFRGVYWEERTQRWRGRVQHNGKYIHVGRFKTAEEAGKAVKDKRNELFTHNELDRIAV